LSEDLSNENQFGSALDELDRSESQIIIRMELRKRRKPVTIVEGITRRTGNKKGELQHLATELKRRLATGGTAKDDTILLQGDQRDKTKDELVRLGYPKDSIDVY
jgi:translation initiation factor 1